MLDANSLFNYEVVGSRPDDDLPCHECGEYRTILIVKFGECTRDVCHDCAIRLGIGEDSAGSGNQTRNSFRCRLNSSISCFPA